MYETVELARILDVSETLLKTTCWQNSAMASLSIMAKIPLPEKLEPKIISLHTEHTNEKRSSCTPPISFKTPSSPGSSIASSYSSSTDTNEFSENVKNEEDCSLKDLKEMIKGVQQMQIVKSFKDDDAVTILEYEEEQSADANSNFVYKRNIDIPEDEKSEESLRRKDAEKEEEDEEAEESKECLVKRGPVRPQSYTASRARPYVEASHHWATAVVQPSELPTDYDTSAKEILTDREYREKIDFCLDKLSDMSQEASTSNSLSPTGSDFGGASGYSPPQQPWHSNTSPTAPRSGSLPLSSQFVPSIKISDAESSLMEMISRGSLKGAQASPSRDLSSLTCNSDNWPDSPTSSYNTCGTSVSRPNSQASSDPHSPGSIASCNGASTFFNMLGSPMVSPLLPVQNFRNLSRPSSSSSSNQSYCETPSPSNYQNPLDQNTEEQLGQHLTSTLPISRSSLTQSSDDLQLVEELIRGEMNDNEQKSQADQYQRHIASDIQVVPTCRNPSSPNISHNYSVQAGNQMSAYHCDTIVDQATGNKSESGRHQLQESRYNLNDNQQSTIGFEPMKSYVSGSECDSANNDVIKATYSPNFNLMASPEGGDMTDDLTNTLLRFVGTEQTHRKVEPRSSPHTVTSTYNDSEIKESSNVDYLQMEAPTNNLSVASMNTTSHQPQEQHQSYYQQCMDINTESRRYPPITLNLDKNPSWCNYNESHAIAGTSSADGQYNFPLTESVTNYNMQTTSTSSADKKTSPASLRKRRIVNCQRKIAPFPYLSLPSTSASERLKAAVGPQKLQRSMNTLLKTSNEELARQDADGYTSLMCLVCNPDELKAKLSFLAPLVERLGTIQGVLTLLNNNGHDALYLTAMRNPQMAFVTGYLAAALLKNKFDIGSRLYHGGETLIHAVVSRGDTHGQVLAELLSLKTAQGNAVFDLAKRNYEGKTALHVAALTHNPEINMKRRSTIASTRLLMESGADPTLLLYTCGDTALHMACSRSCDPALIKSLLLGRGREAVNITNFDGNTPLHLAASNRNVSVERQMEICRLLIILGARANAVNRHGKTPVALVAPDRKDEFRKILPKK